MVRSTPAKASTPPTDTTTAFASALALILWHILRATVTVSWWAVLFPMFSAPVAASTWLWLVYGWPAAAFSTAASCALLTGWRLVHPASFRASTLARIRARYRRASYRSQWAPVCALSGLAPTLNGAPQIPTLKKVRIGKTVDMLTVGMVAGQTLADWSSRCDALAHAWRVPAVSATSPAAGTVLLTIRTRDHLTAPINLPAATSTDLTAVTVGATEDGTPWTVRVAGRHILVAGATGAGKGSVVWSLIAGILPAVTAGTAQLWVIDPKGGMEFGAGDAVFDRFVHATGTPTIELLRDGAALVRERADRYRGHTRAHVPTATEPQTVIIIDELASLTAYETDRKIATEITQLLSLILSQGRAVGVSVIAAAQDPSKEVLTMRQLFPIRVGLRLTEATQVDMALGSGARAAGALCDQIPDTLPGVGYQIEDGTARPLRVRAFHVTDTNIATLTAADHTPPTTPTPPVRSQPREDRNDDPAGKH